MHLDTVSTVVTIVGGIVAILAAILTGVLIPLIKRVRKMLTGWDSFIRDWNGEPAQPGRDATPGVMDRLNNLDGEFKRNHGSTLKDAVSRVEESLEGEEGVKEHLKIIDGRLDRVEAAQTNNPYPKKASTAA